MSKTILHTAHRSGSSSFGEMAAKELGVNYLSELFVDCGSNILSNNKEDRDQYVIDAMNKLKLLDNFYVKIIPTQIPEFYNNIIFENNYNHELLYREDVFDQILSLGAALHTNVYNSSRSVILDNFTIDLRYVDALLCEIDMLKAIDLQNIHNIYKYEDVNYSKAPFTKLHTKQEKISACLNAEEVFECIENRGYKDGKFYLA